MYTLTHSHNFSHTRTLILSRTHTHHIVVRLPDAFAVVCGSQALQHFRARLCTIFTQQCEHTHKAASEGEAKKERKERKKRKKERKKRGNKRGSSDAAVERGKGMVACMAGTGCTLGRQASYQPQLLQRTHGRGRSLLQSKHTSPCLQSNNQAIDKQR